MWGGRLGDNRFIELNAQRNCGGNRGKELPLGQANTTVEKRIPDIKDSNRIVINCSRMDIVKYAERRTKTETCKLVNYKNNFNKQLKYETQH
jgi:hypothetical protein